MDYSTQGLLLVTGPLNYIPVLLFLLDPSLVEMALGYEIHQNVV
jgi:hypothetical protein